MKPKLVSTLPAGAGWVFELKLDGYRALALKGTAQPSAVALFSRNEKPLHFPELAKAVGALPCRSAVLDGEIVALDNAGRSSFQLLQAREMGEGGGAPIVYYLFDLLELDGVVWTSRPLSERKARLAALLRHAEDPLRFSGDLPGEAAAVAAQVKARGLEGIVAKRADSRYEPGLRTGAWVKLKWISEQEFVIGGLTEPKGTRSFFGALLVGYYEGGALRFAGKVGTGFNEKQLAALYPRLQKLRASACPFASFSLPRAEAKKSTWLRPELVCQIKFSEWTRDGRLRHPVFLGMREDRAAREVVRESLTSFR